MQAPTLPVGCIGITDSKHIATPFGVGERHPPCRRLGTHSQGLPRSRKPKQLPGYRHTIGISVSAESDQQFVTAGTRLPTFPPLLRHLPS
jgi:hypothetical protein